VRWTLHRLSQCRRAVAAVVRSALRITPYPTPVSRASVRATCERGGAAGLRVGICDRDDRACVDGDGEHGGWGQPRLRRSAAHSRGRIRLHRRLLELHAEHGTSHNERSVLRRRYLSGWRACHRSWTVHDVVYSAGWSLLRQQGQKTQMARAVRATCSAPA
jgi:hypothetical protein